MSNGTTRKVADRRLEGAMEEEKLERALKTGFWCIQDEVFMRPSTGESGEDVGRVTGNQHTANATGSSVAHGGRLR